MKLFFESKEIPYELYSAAERATSKFVEYNQQYKETDKIDKLASTIAKNEYESFLENLPDKIYTALKILGRVGTFK